MEHLCVLIGLLIQNKSHDQHPEYVYKSSLKKDKSIATIHERVSGAHIANSADFFFHIAFWEHSRIKAVGFSPIHVLDLWLIRPFQRAISIS